jgi:hypothetical protein
VRTLTRVLLPLAACVVPLAPAIPSLAASTGSGGKITICHRTHSTTNPYRRITVSISAANGSSANDHTHHSGPVFDPTYAYPANAKVWGDVIPSTLNWTVAGQAAYAGAGCGVLTAQEFYNVEVEAGQAPADVIADLQEQLADSDVGVELTSLAYTGSDPTYTPAPTPTPTATVDPTPTAPVDPTPTATVDPTPTATVDPTPTATVDPTPTATADPTPTATADPTPTATVDPTPTATADPTPTPTATATVDPTPTPTATVDPTPTVEPTAEPSDGPAEAPTDEPTAGAPAVPAPPVATSSSAALPQLPRLPSARQQLRASAFLDLDADGAWGLAEPGVPALPVTLDGHVVGATDKTGHAVVTALRTTHRAVLTVPADLAVVATSDGAAQSLVRLPASQSRAWWGLRGTSGVALARLRGEVAWTWAGQDGLFGTADDVTGTATAAGAGLSLSGLPAGSYRIAGAAAQLRGGSTLTTLGGGQLAFTGAETAQRAALGLWLVVGGVVLTATARRRRTSEAR